MTLRSVFLLACVSVLWLGCHRDYGLGSQPDATRRYQQVIPLGCPSPRAENEPAGRNGGRPTAFLRASASFSFSHSPPAARCSRGDLIHDEVIPHHPKASLWLPAGPVWLTVRPRPPLAGAPRSSLRSRLRASEREACPSVAWKVSVDDWSLHLPFVPL